MTITIPGMSETDSRLSANDHSARLFFAPVERAEDIHDMQQRALFDYWTGLKGDRLAPDYSDFDVVDVPRHVLPHIFLLEHLPDEDDFLHRVVGSEIDEGNGFSASGKKLKDIDIVRQSDLVDTLQKSLFSMRPCFSESMYYGHDPNGESIHRLSLPLLRDGKSSHLVGVAKIKFSDPPNRPTFGPLSSGF